MEPVLFDNVPFRVVITKILPYFEIDVEEIKTKYGLFGMFKNDISGKIFFVFSSIIIRGDCDVIVDVSKIFFVFSSIIIRGDCDVIVDVSKLVSLSLIYVDERIEQTFIRHFQILETLHIFNNSDSVDFISHLAHGCSPVPTCEEIFCSDFSEASFDINRKRDGKENFWRKLKSF